MTGFRLAVLALVALQRVGELALAQRWLAASRAGQRVRILPERLYAVMVAVHAGWLLGCLVEVVYWPRPWLPVVGWAALAVWLAALGLRVWTLASLGPLWHVCVVQREPQPIVTHGPYRWVRHPNYLVVLLEVAAVPVLLGAYVTAAVATVANGAVLWGRIRTEEAYLFSHPAYRQAFAHKKRLLPGVF